jgi:hypothetical protein
MGNIADFILLMERPESKGALPGFLDPTLVQPMFDDHTILRRHALAGGMPLFLSLQIPTANRRLAYGLPADRYHPAGPNLILSLKQPCNRLIQSARNLWLSLYLATLEYQIYSFEITLRVERNSKDVYIDRNHHPL